MSAAPVSRRAPLLRSAPVQPAVAPRCVTDVVDAVLVRLGERSGTPRLTRLRCKPDGTVVANCIVDPRGIPVCATIAAGTDASPEAISRARTVGQWPGVVDLPDVGVRMEAFPHDGGLPALAALVADAAWVLPGAEVEVIRLKPGSRAVLRLSTAGRLLFVKLYRRREQAQRAWYLAQRLSAEPGLHSHLPAPVRLVTEMHAVVTEAVEPAVSGSLAFRPGRPAPGRALLDAPVPVVGLRAVGEALARLHAAPPEIVAGCNGTGPPAPRSSCRADKPELLRGVGKRVEGWAAEISALSPVHAERARQAAGRTLEALTAFGSATARVGHGAFKPSQVLVNGERLVITDLDDVAMADPARDLGNFLGYLRPDALWRRVDGACRWFDGATIAVTQGYTEASLAAGVAPTEVAQTLTRTGPYAAAALLKRSARRAHRANAPRDDEVGAVLAEITRLLDGPTTRR